MKKQQRKLVASRRGLPAQRTFPFHVESERVTDRLHGHQRAVVVQCKAQRCYESPSRQLKMTLKKNFRALRGRQISTSHGRQISTSRGRQISTSRGRQISTSRGRQISTTRLYTLLSAVNILPYQSQIASAGSVAGYFRKCKFSYKRQKCLQQNFSYFNFRMRLRIAMPPTLRVRVRTYIA